MLFHTMGANARRFLSTAGAAVTTWALLSGSASAQFVGAPRPNQVGLPEAASPIMREMVFFHDAILLPIITVICLFVLGAARLRGEQVQREGQPGALAHDPSHRPRGRLDDHPGADPASSSRSLLPPAEPPARDARSRHDREGDRQRSGTGRGTTRRTRAAASSSIRACSTRRRCRPTSSACWPSTTRWSCRSTRPCACRSPRTTSAHPLLRDALLRRPHRRRPGRLNETWFKAEKEGIYYGQCSELCGKDHAYMPIAVRVVSEDAVQGVACRRRRRSSRPAMTTPVRRR